MNFQLSAFHESFIAKHSFITLVLFLILVAIRLIALRYLKTAELPWTSQKRLRTIAYVKSSFFIVLFFGVLYIWSEEISAFMVSIFAIALAIVTTAKETLMNCNGAFLRFRGHYFEIGDRIAVKGYRGDVIDVSMLATTILEIGKDSGGHQLTGKKVIIPNSILLNEPLTNESFLEHYDLISIKIPLFVWDDWKLAKEILLQIGKEECASYIEQARIKVRSLERSRSLDLPSVEPRISLHLPEPDKIVVQLRVPCLVHTREKIEQNIITRFMDQFKRKNEVPSAKTSL